MSNPAEEEVGVGTIIANTYKIVRVLGRGGMGTVWQADHLRLPGKEVAIKVLHNAVAEDTDSFARFRREAEIACRLGHPNIVEVHDFNKLDNGCPYLILELLDGQDLESKLRTGVLDIETCEHILRQVGSALQSAHEMGVIHRDLKPQNIFLVPSPTGLGPDVAKVLDFGISKIHGSTTVQTQNTTLLGTPQYMAPEQARGDHDNVDGRTDLFALAAMFYELLSGSAAFSGRSIPEVIYKVVHAEPQPILELVPSLAAHKAAAIHKALNKSQEDRHSTVSDFVEAFTGTALPASRARRVSAVSDMAIAKTLDSANISQGVHVPLAVAETLDSQNNTDATLQAPDDNANQSVNVAIAATLDSKQIELEDTSGKTIGSQVNLASPLRDSNISDIASDNSKSSMGRTAKILWAAAATTAAAALVFFAMRGGSPTEQNASLPAMDAASVVAISSIPDASQTLPPDSTQVENGQIAIDAGAMEQPDAKPAKKNTNQRKPTHESGSGEPTNSPPPEYKALLDKAEKALREGRPNDVIAATRKANRLANTMRLHELTAKALCLTKQRGRVMASLRKLNKKKKRVVNTFCANHGFSLNGD